MWQGLLALKNDQAAVQIHFVAGDVDVARHALPVLDGANSLRISQRMRLEPAQLDGVTKKMQVRGSLVVYGAECGLQLSVGITRAATNTIPLCADEHGQFQLNICILGPFQMQNEHCMLLALPCGRDHMDVLHQSNNLRNGFITYLQLKQAAGIINVNAPGTTQVIGTNQLQK
jgi:hypothetical protein